MAKINIDEFTKYEIDKSKYLKGEFSGLTPVDRAKSILAAEEKANTCFKAGVCPECGMLLGKHNEWDYYEYNYCLSCKIYRESD